MAWIGAVLLNSSKDPIEYFFCREPIDCIKISPDQKCGGPIDCIETVMYLTKKDILDTWGQ